MYSSRCVHAKFEALSKYNIAGPVCRPVKARNALPLTRDREFDEFTCLDCEKM